MLLRILIGLIIAYAVLVILAWLFQDRMAFPAPSGALPDHIELQRLGAQRIDLVPVVYEFGNGHVVHLRETV